MAKVLGPLFSVTASGTLGRNLTFLPSNGDHRVRYNNQNPRRRTVPQILHGQRVAACRDSWRHLSQVDKDAWSARSAFMHLSGPALFFREWFSQNIYPPSLPLIPA